MRRRGLALIETALAAGLLALAAAAAAGLLASGADRVREEEVRFRAESLARDVLETLRALPASELEAVLPDLDDPVPDVHRLLAERDPGLGLDPGAFDCGGERIVLAASAVRREPWAGVLVAIQVEVRWTLGGRARRIGLGCLQRKGGSGRG